MQVPDLIHQIGNFFHHLFTLDPNEPFKLAAKVLGILSASVSVVATLVSKTFPWLRAKLESRSVSKLFGEDLFTPKSIERAIRYYIPPSCQSIDPAGGEESRLIHSVQAPLFETFDKALGPESEEKYHILLADSGMGKSSAVINYCVRHQRRWRNKYFVAMVPLGIPDADDRIKKIENKSKTSLFLDALDEDTLAMVDHVERIRLLIQSTHEFRKVVITCRTQFFSTDEEIPRQTGVLKIAVRRAGESAEQLFYKIYLAPFSDDQVTAYLKRRYPPWQRKGRKQAFQMVAKIPLLTARPMLLAHIDDLVKSLRDFEFSFELYEEMVDAWIAREKGFVEKSEELLNFSELLAVDLYINRATRGAERIPKNELNELARNWGIQISDHKLSGRSLLNRDADGNFKFAHRSIMEHLFVQRFWRNDLAGGDIEWTDQMKTFAWERIQRSAAYNFGKNSNALFDFPPFFAKEPAIGNLCDILSFALGPTVSSSFGDFNSLLTRTLLLVCSAILQGQGLNEIEVSLLRCASSVRGYTDNMFVSHFEHKLSWRNGWNSSTHNGGVIICTDRPELLDWNECFASGANFDLDTKTRKVARALKKDRYYGELLVVPIFLGASAPHFVLMATAKEHLRKALLPIFSMIFDPFRRPEPSPSRSPT